MLGGNRVGPKARTGGFYWLVLLVLGQLVFFHVSVTNEELIVTSKLPVD